MNLDTLLAELLAGEPSGDSSDFTDTVSVTDVQSPTALLLDKFSLRRGKEWTESDIGSKVLPTIDESERDNLAADFLAAAWEPEPQLADSTSQERRKEFISAMMQSPEYERLHRTTKLDDVASELAAAGFVKSWVQFAKTDEPEDDLDREAQTYGAAKRAVSEASEDVESLQDMRAACGLGGDGENSSSLGADKTLELFKKIRNSSQLRKIVNLSGRYMRLAQSLQRNKTIHGADEFVDIEVGNDLRRIMPSEIMMLCDEDLELDFFRRFSDGMLMQKELSAVEPEAKGPIVLVVDESGSMADEPIENAKAMALAFLWVAQHQKRWACLVGFSGGTQGNYLVVPPGPRDTDALLDWLNHFYGGGTCVDVPLVELPSKWTELGCPTGRTDIIQITDAIVRAPEKIIASFNAWKVANQVKMNTIVIGEKPGDLEKVSDRWWSINDLNLEAEGVSECLSV